MAYRGNDQKKIVESYASWFEELHSKGLSITSIVFMFNQLPGNETSKIAQMQKEVENVYDMISRRIDNVLYPVKTSDVVRFWIVCPDYPVPKKRKNSIRDVRVNDGLHMNVDIVHVASITKILFDVLEEHERLYVNPLSKICSITPTQLKETPKRGIKYDLKSILRRRVSLDDILILPRTASEQAPWSRSECRDRLKDTPKSKGTGEGSGKTMGKGMPLRAKGRRDCGFKFVPEGKASFPFRSNLFAFNFTHEPTPI
jgi:hypothetical protein